MCDARTDSFVNGTEVLPGTSIVRTTHNQTEFNTNLKIYENVRQECIAKLIAVPDRTMDVRQECVADQQIYELILGVHQRK